SVTAQGSIIVTYEATRPVPQPLLTIRMDGEGQGIVNVTREGDTAPLLHCSKTQCAIEVPTGTTVHVQAILGEDATFGGFHQYPIRTPKALVAYLGDPLASCTDLD